MRQKLSDGKLVDPINILYSKLNLTCTINQYPGLCTSSTYSAHQSGIITAFKNHNPILDIDDNNYFVIENGTEVYIIKVDNDTDKTNLKFLIL